MQRRDFLGRALYFTVAAAGLPLTGCGGSASSGAGSARYDQVRFSMGVASGDPKAGSIVFWTRAEVAAIVEAVDLRLDVSDDPGFSRFVAQVPLTASGRYDFTVRAKVTGLLPNTRYYYRFVSGPDISPTGQSKTLPAENATPAQCRFAWITCQDWSVNHWAAMDLLAKEDLDFLVHLGDYIYESVGASFQQARVETQHPPIQLPDGGTLAGGGHYARTLADYRSLYRTYRSDARLQTLHQRFPWVVVWDDHEFSDDCWQAHQTYSNENRYESDRRRAANQAWAEYMPVDFGDVSFDLGNPGYDNIRIYRDFHFGQLIHLVMTDERLYRDDHVVSEAFYARMVGHDPDTGNDSIGARYFVPEPLLQQFEAIDSTNLKRPPSMLGPTQTAWWKDTMKNSTAAWKVWGNEVTLNRMWLDMRQQAPAPYNYRYIVNADVWDGYPTHKAELMGFLKANGVKDVVAITGDLHAFQCGVVRDLPDPAQGTPVLVDLVTAGISSDSFYSYLKSNAGNTPLAPLVAAPQVFDMVMQANNPDLRYADHDAQGYALATVTADRFVATFCKVRGLNANGSVPDAPLLKKTRITVQRGSSVPQIEDNVA